MNEGSSAVFVSGHGKPFDPRVITAKESMKAKVNAIRKKLVEQVSLKRLNFMDVHKGLVNLDSGTTCGHKSAVEGFLIFFRVLQGDLGCII